MTGTIESAAEYLLGSRMKGAVVNDGLTDSSDDEPPPLVAESRTHPINHRETAQSSLVHSSLGPRTTSLGRADDDELEEKVRMLVECFGVDASDARTALLRTNRGK